MPSIKPVWVTLIWKQHVKSGRKGKALCTRSEVLFFTLIQVEQLSWNMVLGFKSPTWCGDEQIPVSNRLKNIPLDWCPPSIDPPLSHCLPHMQRRYIFLHTGKGRKICIRIEYLIGSCVSEGKIWGLVSHIQYPLYTIMNPLYTIWTPLYTITSLPHVVMVTDGQIHTTCNALIARFQRLHVHCWTPVAGKPICNGRSMEHPCLGAVYLLWGY